MRINYLCLIIAFCCIAFSCQKKVDNEIVKQQILDNGLAIRNAFSEGDIDKIKALHHPDVIKALGYEDIKNGREEVVKGIQETLKSFSLEFIKNDVESILVENNIAIEQSKFSIRGTPKNGGDSFIFSGRTMVTYIRYQDSPTGWATIREIIQPAND